MQIQDYLLDKKNRVEQQLAGIFAARQTDTVLDQAMRYAVMNGGKRLRPVLAYASAEALGKDARCADIAACALELIHSYSLIHDDLPAMDDDDLRRGKPTCHIKFDEASAILAGDALQSLAFELMSSPAAGQSQVHNLQMIAILSRAIGRSGMVLGQSIDFHASGKAMSEQELADMHRLKTGALITASVQLGALSTGVVSEEALEKLTSYARALGLAFQVRDDILDVESDTATLGKQQGKDRELGKTTYPDIFGLDGARARAEALCDEAINALEGFDDAARPLRDIALYIVQRNY